MHSRQLPCAQQPFWYVDVLFDEDFQNKSELLPRSWEQMGSRDLEMTQYKEWLAQLSQAKAK